MGVKISELPKDTGGLQATARVPVVQGGQTVTLPGSDFSTPTSVSTSITEAFVPSNITSVSTGGTPSTVTFNIANTLEGSFYSVTVQSNTTFAFNTTSITEATSPYSLTLELTNGGAYTVTWPASVRWAGGLAPTLTSSGTDIIEFYTRNGGTTWNGFVAGYDMKVPA